jgi:hypothetical protein
MNRVGPEAQKLLSSHSHMLPNTQIEKSQQTRVASQVALWFQALKIDVFYLTLIAPEAARPP